MYSSSNSFLGGANSARPGQPPFAQQPSYSQFPPSQQQSQLQTGFTSQTTGYAPQFQDFGGSQLQPQLTGFPGGQLQPQFTGLPGGAPQQPQPTTQQPQQSFQPPFQQPQVTGYHPQSQPPQIQLPQTTGLPSRPAPKTSSEIANSFQDGFAGAPQPPPKPSASKIPNIRLSFITAQDQAKFEQLFKSAVGDNQTMDGEKAKELLMRSKLPGSDLSKIWILSDSTKSGQLFFPEFALAMYLCNLRITGRDLPASLPERIKNEVSSMVDIISFQVPDTQPEPATMTNVPNFDAPVLENKFAPPAPQQPQPQQPTNSQLLSQMTAQPTGIPPQPTGLQPQQTAFAGPNQQIGPQPTGFPAQQPAQQPQPTGFMTNPQPTGYSGPRPPLPPMPTGFGSNLSPAQTGGTLGLAPQPTGLVAQPTGVPGQWGFVNAPTTGLPNIEALKQQLMPQPGREGGFSTSGLSGNATVPWAITKEEKRIYDDLFRAWDGFRKGYIGGETAIEIMGQSGLNRQDLERIWTLADPHNRGRLNMDEFAVAMHLIYRKLNGYPVPSRLPPELVPPSTRNLNDSIGTMKSLLSQDAESRKASGAFLQPQKTGVSYLKEHSFRGSPGSPGIGRKDATMFKNNDEAVGYRSSARRRVGNNGRTPSPATSSQASEDELSVTELKKKIRETKVMLDAVDFQDESRAEEDDALDRRDRREAESLMDRIRRVQDDIDTHPNASFRHLNSGPERRSIRRQLQSYQDQIPQIASDVRVIEREIAEAKLELFRLKDAKAHPDSASNIAGTGPGGTVTEADRIKARARARMQARAAELAGRPVPASSDDDGSAARRLEAENANVKADKERNDNMTRDVEDSVREFATSLEDGLRDETESSSREHERRRWEDALGVEDVIRDFIYDLNRGSRTAHVRKEEESRPMPAQADRPRYDSQPLEATTIARTPSPRSTGSPGAKNTHEDRVAAARERAQKRIAERMAAAGLKPQSDSTETLVQRQEREKRDREDRLRRAEEEDAKREQERQRRLAEEQHGPVAPATKPAGKKPPPAPPSRRARTDSAGQAEARKAEESGKTEQAVREQVIKEEQQAQEEERKRLEDAARAQETEFQKEKEAHEARLRALEEQVKQGKMKKQEEKRRKEEADKLAKENEAKLAAQHAELEQAKERERQLQLELEGLDEESSSDDEAATNITPQDSTPTQSQVLNSAPAVPSVPKEMPPETTAQPPTFPEQPPAASEPEEVASPGSQTVPADIASKNPYFRKISSDGLPPSQPPIPQTTVTSPKAEVSTNPFHRLAQQESSKTPFTAPPLEQKSRVRPEEDDWSAAGSEFDSSEDEDENPGGGSAKQLASILFGTMAPPRPLSPMEDKAASKSATPVPETPAAPPAEPEVPAGPSAIPPPPPPPAPAPAPAAPASSDDASEASPPPPAPAPVAPPPPPPAAVPPPPPPAAVPPPPAPPSAPGGGPPGDRSALLSSIQAGKSLKKVQTSDRSTSSSAGRVLG